MAKKKEPEQAGGLVIPVTGIGDDQFKPSLNNVQITFKSGASVPLSLLTPDFLKKVISDISALLGASPTVAPPPVNIPDEAQDDGYEEVGCLRVKNNFTDIKFDNESYILVHDKDAQLALIYLRDKKAIGPKGNHIDAKTLFYGIRGKGADDKTRKNWRFNGAFDSDVLRGLWGAIEQFPRRARYHIYGKGQRAPQGDSGKE